MHRPVLFLLAATMTLVSAADGDPATNAMTAYVKHPIGSTKAPYGFIEHLPPAAANADKKAVFPLVFFMHGHGELGDSNNDLPKLAQHGPFKHLVANDAIGKLIDQNQAIVIAPQGLKSDNWFKGEHLVATLKYVLETYPVDPQRIYVTGLSMGGGGTWTVASAMPDKVAAAMPVCGAGKVANADKLRGIPLNNGIATSQYVYATFQDAGYDIRHLDHTHTAVERREILDWFKNKPDAILTSVSILTTGFDEPTVESIILNRATKSLTLYFQMIGRGSRILPGKKEFMVIDLGNNLSRFGLWDSAVEWKSIFQNPELYLSGILSDEEIEKSFRYEMPQELRDRFKNSQTIDFDVRAEHQLATSSGLRPKVVIQRSLDQHLEMCLANSSGTEEALELADLLKDEIAFRVRVFCRCLSKTSESYVKWLQDDYKLKLKLALIRKGHHDPQEG